MFPEGFAWVAEVATRGLAPEDRLLHICADGSRIHVRSDDGSTLWSGPTREIFGHLTGEGQGSPGSPSEAVLARDSGAEAVAMLSLDQLFDWANAVGRLPERRTGPVCVPGEDHSFVADVDPQTGLVSRVATVAGSGHDIEITAAWRLVPMEGVD